MQNCSEIFLCSIKIFLTFFDSLIFKFKVPELTPSISHLKIFASFACNLHCPHCVHNHIRNGYEDAHLIPTQDLQRFLSDIAEFNPDLHVYLSGGEPFASPYFFSLARELHKVNLGYKTITNGTLIKKSIENLVHTPPRKMWVTFNGLDESHDATVGIQGGYARLREDMQAALPVLHSAGIFVGAVLLINPLSYPHLVEAFAELSNLGFDEIVIQHLSFLSPADLAHHQAVYQQTFGIPPSFCFGEGAVGDQIDAHIVYEQLQSILTSKDLATPAVIFPPIIELEALSRYYGETTSIWTEKRCDRAPNELWILPDGTVTLCFAHPIGHISQGLNNILASAEMQKWQEIFYDLPHAFPGCMRCHRLYMKA